MTTTNSSSLSNISNKKILPSVIKKEMYFLQKKTKRSNFMNKKKMNLKNKTPNKTNYVMNSKFPKNINKTGCKTVTRPKNKRKKRNLQSRLNDFFEKPNFKDINNGNKLLKNIMIKESDIPSSIPNLEEHISSNNEKINNKSIQKKEEVAKDLNIINPEKKDENIELTQLKQQSNNNIDKYIPLNPFSKFSNIINNYKEPKKVMIDNYNNFINNGIFNKSEISLALDIQKEFKKEINNITSETDRLIKGTIFFINKGFNEHIRYIFYKCLVNYGFPLFNNFNHFYENFISDCSKEKISATPDKMYIEFYTEYIFHLLINDKISMSKNIFITNFFFNGENIEIIKKNLNFIIDVKENSNNIRSYIQNYLELNYDIVFNEIDIKLNKAFPKSKAVLCKILSNIVSECDKIGYLKYKKIINNDNILFDGLKIKSNINIKMNFRKMISFKIFGQEFSDKKFYNLIQDYLLQLFSHYNN